jgi:hypothetical protein
VNGAGFSFANLAWWQPVLALALLAAAGTVVAQRRAGIRAASRAGLLLRLGAIVILALALLEPSWSTPRVRPGANHFLVLADNSRSLGLPGASGRPRAETLKMALAGDRPWHKRLAELFQVRRYRFDQRTERVADFDGLTFDGRASNLGGALATLAERWKGAPLAGVLLFTDGNATDEAQVLAAAGPAGPPVYPVIIGAPTRPVDLAVAEVSASDTLFEDAPVSIEARIEALGAAGKTATIELRDDHDHLVETRAFTPAGDDVRQTVTFRVGPAKHAAATAAPSRHYRVIIAAPTLAEATTANNARRVLVPHPQGPARLLYVAGRPNWEYKFLRRALDGDRVLELAALLRVAPREPKFAFLAHKGEANNPLFRGFGTGADDAERFDEPVLQRLGTRSPEELRGGFPKTAEELFEFQGIIIDDLEAGFFTAAQQALVDRFVAERGGGFLMLGGVDSFRRGGYARTPIGDLLPVYLDRMPDAGPFTPARFALSREGWLEAWTRLRDNEAAERARLAAMPAFKIASATRGLKPGATVLATLTAGKTEYPALVMHRAGEGRSAALTVGDLWRWALRRAPSEPDDLGKFWRQTLRALVRDVPRPVTATLEPSGGQADALTARVRVRGPDFQPVDAALVSIEAVAPDGAVTPLQVTPSSAEPGSFEAELRPQAPGVYRVNARARTADGRDLGAAEAGRVLDLDADEQRSVRPNRPLLEQLAQRTGGAVVELAALDDFVDRLRDRPAPVSELETRPLWHSSWVLLAVLGGLLAQWALWRRRGLP